jgi:Fic family protein
MPATELVNGREPRTYTRTHPWLAFSVDLRRAPTDLWLLLGEAQSKIEHIAGSLLKPCVADQLQMVYLAKGALATTAIEGNTLSEEQAVAAVQGTLQLPPSQQYLQQEITNVVNACNEIKDELIAGGSPLITVEDIKHYNRLVMDGLELDEGVIPGEISERGVAVANYRGAPREDCDYLLGELCRWLNERFEPPTDRMLVPFAILKAVLAHLYLAWIHPFGDGNGRTARLVELKLQLGAGFPMPASQLLSNHYNQTRTEYYRQLDRSSHADEGVISFLMYAVEGLVDGLRSQLLHIRLQQFRDRWEQFVYETFGGDTHSPAKRRQLELVLALSDEADPVLRSKLTSLNAHLAAAYATKTKKTLTRDLNTLIDMGLVEQTPGGVRPRSEVILAFLPVVPALTDD